MAEETVEQDVDAGISFSEEQQTHIDSVLIPRVRSQVQRRFERDTQERQEPGLNNTEKDELTQLRQAQTERQQEETARQTEEKTEFQRLLEDRDKAHASSLQNANEELEAEKQRSESMYLSNAVKSALARSSTGILPEMMTIAEGTLTRGTPLTENDDEYRIVAKRSDNGQFNLAVVDPSGMVAINGKGEDLTVDQAVDLFLSKYQSFVPANVRNGGSGSLGSRPAGGDNLSRDYDVAMDKARRTGKASDRQTAMRLRREQL
ncbi:MAG TPA: hypothetical protein EYO58_10545, partial [Flavobacteriales bacterium]|nr:hypothetical protein [Flavobacteriales bacterium]